MVAFYALGHVPPEAHGRLLARAVSWLRPGDLLLINVPVTAGEVVEPDWLGVPMYFGEVIEEDEDDLVVRFLWVVGEAPS